VQRTLGGVAFMIAAIGFSAGALAGTGDGMGLVPLPSGESLNHSHIDGLNPFGDGGYVPPPPTGDIPYGGKDVHTAAPVPEPATLTLLIASGAALLRRRR
jgi:hypothetical protein